VKEVGHGAYVLESYFLSLFPSSLSAPVYHEVSYSVPPRGLFHDAFPNDSWAYKQ
jgi:hypothetical protein